ncbi:serpentine type 7TM GPCR chemoreceptor srt domain-containing protein [Ditylenchus destructor]|nr:serpentine type 7TM GPCR chemoreceptor srt domain-containing protein [Ditylenchus destructor]
MELFIFRYPKYEEIYNCSYDINSIPVKQRIHHADGYMMLGLSALFVAIYIPTLIVMWKHISKTAYQLMFIIGFADAIILTFGGIPNGIMSLTGVVFCSYPTPFYISACWLGGIWVFSTEMSVVLALYRCLELAKLVTNVGNNPSSLTACAADWFFEGKRSLVWTSLSLLHSITAATFGAPLLYSPIFGTMLLNPHAGYIEDTDERFYNLHFKLYNIALFCVLVVLFIAFVYLIRSQSELNSSGPSLQLLAAQKKLLVHAVIISSCFAVSITYWGIVFSGRTLPRIATFIGMTISICAHGTHDGVNASGTPLIWTTNVTSNPAFNNQNAEFKLGDHYWMVDLQMECNKTNYAASGSLERQLKANGFSIFNHQSEIFDVLDLKEYPNRRIFAFEISRHVPGIRKFVYTELRDFAEWYLAPSTSPRNFHEIILEETPCRLFLDLEYLKALNPAINQHETIEECLDVCARMLTSLIGEPVDKSNFLILESSTVEKYSAHVIIHLPGGRLFRSMKDLNAVIKTFDQQLYAENAVIVNTGLKTRPTRHLCDTIIYTPLRNFRMFLSSKIGYHTPFTVADYCTFYEGQMPSQEEVFFDSLIIPEDFHLCDIVGLQLLEGVKSAKGVRRQILVKPEIKSEIGLQSTSGIKAEGHIWQSVKRESQDVKERPKIIKIWPERTSEGAESGDLKSDTDEISEILPMVKRPKISQHQTPNAARPPESPIDEDTKSRLQRRPVKALFR